MRIAILGRTHWLTDTAVALQAAGHEIVLVATAPPAPEYRVGTSDFEALARKTGAPFYEDPDCNSAEFVRALRTSGAEIGVSVNWPKLIRAEACGSLPRGVLNAHAGDLPRYRGNACPNWAILNDEPHVGLCVHAMDPDEVDAGPVYIRERFALAETTSITDVYAWLDKAIPALFTTAVGRAADAAFTPEDQKASGVTPLRCHPRRPDDGLIDWTSKVSNIDRLVRASSRPFAGAFAFLDGSARVTVWRARPLAVTSDVCAVPGQILGRSADGGVIVACGDGALLILETTVEGGGSLPSANRHRLTSNPASD